MCDQLFLFPRCVFAQARWKWQTELQCSVFFWLTDGVTSHHCSDRERRLIHRCCLCTAGHLDADDDPPETKRVAQFFIYFYIFFGGVQGGQTLLRF